MQIHHEEGIHDQHDLVPKKIFQHQFRMIHHRVYRLDEDINDDFLRDAIKSIAHHYNSHYPGNIVVSISIVYFYINNVQWPQEKA